MSATITHVNTGLSTTLTLTDSTSRSRSVGSFVVKGVKRPLESKDDGNQKITLLYYLCTGRGSNLQCLSISGTSSESHPDASSPSIYQLDMSSTRVTPRMLYDRSRPYSSESMNAAKAFRDNIHPVYLNHLSRGAESEREKFMTSAIPDGLKVSTFLNHLSTPNATRNIQRWIQNHYDNEIPSSDKSLFDLEFARDRQDFITREPGLSEEFANRLQAPLDLTLYRRQIEQQWGQSTIGPWSEVSPRLLEEIPGKILVPVYCPSLDNENSADKQDDV
ncbi:uncharacterized protein L199_000837 [Kwoniella botswanensis]|uniref:uncharacterized protein n=1 Tax=Kwoniella botswanensis TaxID=1268659 RepID=UPI00315DF123